MRQPAFARAARFPAGSRWIAGVFTMLLLLAGPALARADELSAWYRSDPRSAAYTSVREGLREVFADGKREHVPLWVLGEKLREGVSKKVPADALLRCVRGEEARLERAQRILARAGAPGAGVALTSKGERSLKAVGIYLRAGLPDPVIGELLAAGAAASRGEDAALSACETIVTLRNLAPIADADSLAIGKLLIASSIEPPRYASLGPVFARARTRGFSDDHIVKDVIIGTLSSGGGAEAMDEKIEKGQPPAARVVRATAPKKIPAAPAAALSPGVTAPAEPVVTPPVIMRSVRGSAPPGSPSGGRSPGGTSAPGIGASSPGPQPASMGSGGTRRPGGN